MKTPVPTTPPILHGVFFSTLRLRNALPEHFVQNLGLQYYARQQVCAANPERENYLLEARKRLFARYDEALDMERFGPGIFREPQLVRIVADEIARRDGPESRVLACSILPNHIHLLLEFPGQPQSETPCEELDCSTFKPLRQLLSDIRQSTEAPLSSEISKLGKTLDEHRFEMRGPNGNMVLEGSLWHERSFDFRVLDAAAFEKAARYIARNSERAGTAKDKAEWPLS